LESHLNLLSRRIVGAALVCAALVMGALEPVSPPAAHAQGAPAAVQIEMGDYYFGAPGTRDYKVTAPVGQVKFTFHNNAQRKHNFVVEQLDQRIPDVDAGRTYETTFTFNTPGTYSFYCDLPTHAQRGMTGTLTVVAAAPGAPSASGAPGSAPVPAATTGTTSAGTAGASASPAAGNAAAPVAQPAPGAQTGQATQVAPSAQAGTRHLPLLISLAIHIPSVIAWLGVVLYDAIVVTVPFLTPPQRGSLLMRPRWIVVAALPLFTITGIYQTINNPISTVTDFASLEALRNDTTYGLALFLKHGFVFASIALTFAVTFWLAPKLVALAADTREAPETRSRLPLLLSAANVAACAALLLCVAVMVFQLH
jgi:plastocyanin